jgi:hypothetical protein
MWSRFWKCRDGFVSEELLEYFLRIGYKLGSMNLQRFVGSWNGFLFNLFLDISRSEERGQLDEKSLL